MGGSTPDWVKGKEKEGTGKGVLEVNYKKIAQRGRKEIISTALSGGFLGRGMPLFVKAPVKLIHLARESRLFRRKRPRREDRGLVSRGKGARRMRRCFSYRGQDLMIWSRVWTMGPGRSQLQ